MNEEKMNEGINVDYWFLRKNGIPAKIALRMLSIAYKVKERLEARRQ